jgi:ABC-type transport system substrate-binding protein
MAPPHGDFGIAKEASPARQRSPQLVSHIPSKPRHTACHRWIESAAQWDSKAPWHDQRVHLAVNYALDRQAIKEAACLGYCPPAGVIVPRLLDYALPAEPFPYDPQKAVQLLADAGYLKGFDVRE